MWFYHVFNQSTIYLFYSFAKTNSTYVYATGRDGCRQKYRLSFASLLTCSSKAVTANFRPFYDRFMIVAAKEKKELNLSFSICWGKLFFCCAYSHKATDIGLQDHTEWHFCVCLDVSKKRRGCKKMDFSLTLHMFDVYCAVENNWHHKSSAILS